MQELANSKDSVAIIGERDITFVQGDYHQDASGIVRTIVFGLVVSNIVTICVVIGFYHSVYIRSLQAVTAASIKASVSHEWLHGDFVEQLAEIPVWFR